MSLKTVKYMRDKPANRPRTIAERGWLGALIDDQLRPALKMAEKMASDLDNLGHCDAADCGRMFDTTDPRSSSAVDHGTKYLFCPGCTLEHDASKS